MTFSLKWKLNIFLVFWIFCSASLPALAQDPSAKPNFVVITLDDMQWQTFGYLDPDYSRFTPFLTEYAQSSITFLNSYVPLSLCTPTRASLFTGVDPHKHGVTHHRRHIFEGVQTLVGVLSTEGYATGLIGKTRHTLVNRKKHVDYVIGPENLGMGRAPSLFRHEVQNFIAKFGDQPFFLNVNIHDPHTPYPGRDGLDRWKSYIQFLADRSGFTSLLQSARLDYQGTPPHDSVKYAEEGVPVYPYIPDLPASRKEMAQILTAANRADESVKQVISALQESGVADNTVVVIFSDNGAALPFSKSEVYLNSLRAGLLIRAPMIDVEGGLRKTAIVSVNDIYPTVLDLADVQYLPASIDGQSLIPLLDGSINERDFRRNLMGYFFYRFPQRAIFDGRYWYIWNAWVDGSRKRRGHFLSSLTYQAMDRIDHERLNFLKYRKKEELYNVQTDPNSKNDLVGTAETKTIIEKLRSDMLKHMRANDDPLWDEFRKFLREKNDDGLE